MLWRHRGWEAKLRRRARRVQGDFKWPCVGKDHLFAVEIVVPVHEIVSARTSCDLFDPDHEIPLASPVTAAMIGRRTGRISRLRTPLWHIAISGSAVRRRPRRSSRALARAGTPAAHP